MSAYLPYESPVTPPGPALERIVNFCKGENIPMIIGSDSNSHHTIWGSSDINRRGEELIQYLVITDLIILNRGKKPTFVNAIRKEILDITLATCGISDTFMETFSDHKLIKFSLRGNFPRRQPFRNLKRTDCDKYRCLLKGNLERFEFHERYLTYESLEKANEELTLSIVNAYESAWSTFKS